MIVNGGAVQALNCHRGCMRKMAVGNCGCGLVMCCWCHLRKGIRAYR